MIVTIILVILILFWIGYAIHTDPEGYEKLSDERKQELAAKLQAQRKRKRYAKAIKERNRNRRTDN